MHTIPAVVLCERRKKDERTKTDTRFGRLCTQTRKHTHGLLWCKEKDKENMAVREWMRKKGGVSNKRIRGSKGRRKGEEETRGATKKKKRYHLGCTSKYHVFSRRTALLARLNKAA